MNRGKIALTVTPLLIGVGIALSACAADSDYAGNAGYTGYTYDYNYPAYGSLDFDYWGGCCGDHHGFGDHGSGDHGFGDHGFGGHGGGRR